MDMATQILDARTWTRKERRKNGKRKHGLLRRVKWRQTASTLSQGGDLHVPGGGTKWPVQRILC